MLALCLILSMTHYTQNHASIIGESLTLVILGASIIRNAFPGILST